MSAFRDNFIKKVKEKALIAKLEEIEKKSSKTIKPQTTLNQQMLLLEELGLLKELRKLNLSDVKLASVLSALLNGDKDNIRKSLSQINLKDSKLKTAANYSFLHKIFDESSLDKLSKQADKEYNRIVNQKEK